VWWFLMACADSTVSEPPAPVPAPAPAPAPEPEPRKERKHGKGAGRDAGKRAPTDGDPQPRIPATGIPDPLAGLGTAQICSSNTLLMVKYPFASLQKGKCAELCCATDPEHWCCGMDWPFNDVPPCDTYSHLRNELFSRYGYPFDSAEWKNAFDDTSWYRRREDFRSEWMTDAAQKNVETLQRLEKDRVGCMD